MKWVLVALVAFILWRLFVVKGKFTGMTSAGWGTPGWPSIFNPRAVVGMRATQSTPQAPPGDVGMMPDLGELN